MPTNQNAYNSRVTTEALEKKFRDTFPSQGGAELVDDLYASGVIVPVVDFSDAAAGSVLPESLQQAWDFATTFYEVENATTTIANTPGFWKVDLTVTYNIGFATGPNVRINDGLGTKRVWEAANNAASQIFTYSDGKFIVYLRSGDSLEAVSNQANDVIAVWTRQIADVSGNLVNPLGFTSS